MGIATTTKVVTSSDRIGKAITTQLGNWHWVTIVEYINASGWALPPFIILMGKVHQSTWYTNLPNGWVIALSDNGWTTNELGVYWIKYFNTYTEHRTKGAYPLILDGHRSYISTEFDQL
jgi:hypothetical protein